MNACLLKKAAMGNDTAGCPKKGPFRSTLGLASAFLRRPGKRAVSLSDLALKSRASIVPSWVSH